MTTREGSVIEVTVNGVSRQLEEGDVLEIFAYDHDWTVVLPPADSVPGWAPFTIRKHGPYRVIVQPTGEVIK